MTHSGAESAKSTKRKGTRSVSTLSPAQLARKRANDREAQRAIRARTKEHIENLERELEELRSKQFRDDSIEDLMRKNRALEEEIRRLRATKFPSNSPTQSASQGRTSPTSSFEHSPSSSHHLPHHIPAYTSMPESAEAWASSVPCSVSSTVSSPASSSIADDFVGTSYFSGSGTSSMFDRTGLPPGEISPPTIPVMSNHRMDEVKSEYGGSHPNVYTLPSSYPNNQQNWNMYPVYYHGSHQ